MHGENDLPNRLSKEVLEKRATSFSMVVQLKNECGTSTVTTLPLSFYNFHSQATGNDLQILGQQLRGMQRFGCLEVRVLFLAERIIRAEHGALRFEVFHNLAHRSLYIAVWVLFIRNTEPSRRFDIQSVVIDESQ